MAALSGRRYIRLLMEDFKAMIDDGTIYANARLSIPIIFLKGGGIQIEVGSRRAIKIYRWLDKKYAYIKDGVIIHEYPIKQLNN